MSSGLAMSAWTATPRRPSKVICATVAARPASSMSQTVTSAPWSARPIAIARPIPAPAPVTTATRPVRSKSLLGMGESSRFGNCSLSKSGHDPIVPGTEVLLNDRDRARLVPVAQRVEHHLVAGAGEFAKVGMGDVAAEEEDVDLRSQICPALEEPLVVAGAIDDLVEPHVELGRLLLGHVAFR